MQKAVRKLGGVLFATMLTACGGGSGGTEDLAVSFNYGGPYSIRMWGWTSISPGTDGLKGNSPSCAVASGALPPGLAFRGCTLEGYPTQPGQRYSAVIRLTVSGYKGSVEAPLSIEVSTPTIEPILDPRFGGYSWPWGTTRDPRAFWRIENFSSVSPDEITYAVVSGQLPAGLSVSSRGEVFGQTTDMGEKTIQITARLRRGTLEFTTQPTTAFINVTPPTYYYVQTRSVNLYSGYSACCYLAWGAAVPALEMTAAYNGGGTVSYVAATPFPPGLTLDSVTGQISGSVELTSDELVTTQIDQHIIHPSGERAVSPTSLVFRTSLYGMYDKTPVRLGQPFLISRPPLASGTSAETWSYSLSPDNPANPLPSWLQLNSSTGELSGTPTDRQYYRVPFRVTATIIRNGVSQTKVERFNILVQ